MLRHFYTKVGFRKQTSLTQTDSLFKKLYLKLCAFFCSDALIMMMIVACVGGKTRFYLDLTFFWKLGKIRSMSFTMSRWCICFVWRTKSRLYHEEQLFLYDLTIRMIKALKFFAWYWFLKKLVATVSGV